MCVINNIRKILNVCMRARHQIRLKLAFFLLLSPVVAPFSHQIKYKISLQDEREIRPMARLFYVCAVHVYATKPKRTDAFHQVGFPISMQINNNNSATISIIQMESFLLNVSSRENIFFLIWSLGFSKIMSLFWHCIKYN